MENSSLDLEYMNNINRAVSKTLDMMSERLIEREQLSRLILLTFFCKANCFLIGKRGVAKSYAIEMLGNSIKNTKELWQLLLKKDTKIEEIFGRTYQGENGEWKINTKGSLLEADNVFADEMFKATGETLSGLLEVLVDRTFTFGDGKKNKTDIIAFFGASNEYPTEKFMLPYVDRFDIWVEVSSIQNRTNRKKFYLDQFIADPIKETGLSKEDIYKVYNQSKLVQFPEHIIELYIDITSNFINSQIKTSDRKYKRIINMIKTIAYLNNREEVNTSDLFILLYSAWQDEFEKGHVERILHETVFGKKEEIKTDIKAIEVDYENVLNAFNSGLYKFYNNTFQFSGDGQEDYFNKIRNDFLIVFENYEILLSNIEYVYSRYEYNKLIQRELDKNLIIHGVKENVFDSSIIFSMKQLEEKIKTSKYNLNNWLVENKDIYHYKTIQKRAS